MKKYYLLPVLGIFLLSSHATSAASGCCYRHGGVSHCDAPIGRQVCNDGTYSPSCTCGKEVMVDPPMPPKITPMDKWKIISKISSVKDDYSAHHQGFRESLIQYILELTDGNFVDTIGYYVYKMLPDIKE